MKKYIGIAGLIFLVISAYGRGVYSIHNATQQRMDVSGCMEYVPTAPTATLKDILSDSLQNKFQPFEVFWPRLRQNTADGKHFVFWGKVLVKNETDKVGNYFFETAGFDSVTIYWGGSDHKMTIYKDADLKKSLYDTIGRYCYFGRAHIYILPGEEANVYIRYVRPAAARSMIFNLLLYDVQRYTDFITREFAINGLILGVLLLTFLYSVFLFYAFRERAYLWFCVMELGFLFLLIDWGHFGVAFIGKRQVWALIDKHIEIIIILPSILLGSYMFANNLIRFNVHYPRLHRFFVWFICICLLTVIGAYLYLGDNNLLDGLEYYTYLISVVLILLVSGMAALRKIPYALVMFVSLLVLQLPIFYTIVFNVFLSVHWLEEALCAQSIIWLAIITFKIKSLRDTFIKTQSDLVVSLQNNQELITKQNEELEQKVEERTANLKTANALLSVEKKKSEDLLLNILPAEVAEELKEKGTANAKQFDDVTVLFTDFVNFTESAALLTPQQLVNELDACFRAFDGIISKYDIEKIKTVGDAYMAVAGLPKANTGHAESIVSAAIEINAFMQERLAKLGDSTYEIRMGIHSGSVVAGIVGVKKFAYDIWGDTVNIAARMEQNSEPGKINISQTTYELVRDKFDCAYRGEIDAKGKGMLKMYFVSGGK